MAAYGPSFSGKLVCPLVARDTGVSFDPSDVYRPVSQLGNAPVNFQGLLLAGPGSRVSRPRDSTGGIRVDDQGTPFMIAGHEPCKGSLDGGDLGAEGRLPGAQGFASLGYDLTGSILVRGNHPAQAGRPSEGAVRPGVQRTRSFRWAGPRDVVSRSGSGPLDPLSFFEKFSPARGTTEPRRYAVSGRIVCGWRRDESSVAGGGMSARFGVPRGAASSSPCGDPRPGAWGECLPHFQRNSDEENSNLAS